MSSQSYMARSSSGSGRRPLKAEITSSNLVRATKCSRTSSEVLFVYLNVIFASIVKYTSLFEITVTPSRVTQKYKNFY